MNGPRGLLRFASLAVLAGGLLGLVTQCSETVSPAPPDEITIESGNLQYSLRGTELPEPLVVRVRTAEGDVPEEAHVAFSVLQGGGTLSKTSVKVDGAGRASTSFTLGSELGTNVVRAAIREQSSKSVLFELTSANFFCPEQEDTLRVGYGQVHRLFLAARKSSLFPSTTGAGVVEINVDLASPPLDTRGFAEIAGSFVFEPNVFDAAFSARGDFYVARRALRSEILKISTSGVATTFAQLDEDLPPTELYAEIATNPSGLLVGCDAKGPFVVGCRDSLTRFAEATYPAATINNDALAVDPRRQSEDPLGEDIYFIDESTSELKRLALDSLAVEARGLETVASLPSDEAPFATGMACEPAQGRVYILIDSETRKKILEVTPDGVVDTLYNFILERGPGDAAGVQRDLVYDVLRGFRYLYTLDTLNDNLLRFDVGSRTLVPMFNDSLLQSTLSNRGMGGQLIGGERVGLAVLR
jgi:hypothetical protein